MEPVANPFIPADLPDSVCVGCGKSPEQLSEYWPEATGESIDPTTYVKSEEGTYNKDNGHFLCTQCYIEAGMPSHPNGWKAP